MKASRPRSPGYRQWTVRRSFCKPESAILSVNSGILDLKWYSLCQGSADGTFRRKLVGDIPKVLNWWNFVYLADFELKVSHLNKKTRD